MILLNETLHTEKAALVLAGGGVTGALYEIGALCAFENLLTNFKASDFDIYVGTSAGALVTSMLVNGMSPHDLLRAAMGEHPDLPQISRTALFRPNYGGFFRWWTGMPLRLAGALKNIACHPKEGILSPWFSALSEGFPAGLCNNGGLENYLHRAFHRKGRTDDFMELSRELFIVATELDSGKRVAFSNREMSHVPISKAVAASTALPLLYSPVEIDGRAYVDGAARANASLDIAIERGAKLVVCINPLVPFDHNRGTAEQTDRTESVWQRRGMPVVIKQLARIQTHAGVEYHIKQLRRVHRGTDILLIEPRPTDYEMFLYDIMYFAARNRVAQHSYERVMVQLASNHARVQKMLARHGIEMRGALSHRQLRAIHRAKYDGRVIRNEIQHSGVPLLYPSTAV